MDLKKNLSSVWSNWDTDNRRKNLESKSGVGSSTINTEDLRKKLDSLFQILDIKSMIDAPCGDFNWMRIFLKNKTIQYIGIDIIEKNIINNNLIYKNDLTNFYLGDLRDCHIPKADLIFCRDCLVHLSHQDNEQIIKNFKKSDCKYLMMTTFSAREHNPDTNAPNWRPLNMRLYPYKFPEPIFTINENCSENRGKYSDKSICVWDLQEIQL